MKPKEKAIVILLRAGQSRKEIAPMLGLTSQRVGQIIADLRARFASNPNPEKRIDFNQFTRPRTQEF